MRTRWLIGTMALLNGNAAMAGGPPVLEEIIYIGAKTGDIITVTKENAPAESALVGDYISLCGKDIWVEGKTKAWIGNTLLADFGVEDSGCVAGKVPLTPMSGKIKITTPYGKAVSSHIIRTVVNPAASKCKLTAKVSAKWGNPERTSLLMTLTFKNSGPVNCWLYEPEATGKFFPGGPFGITTDGACFITATRPYVTIDRESPTLAKLILAPGKSVSTQFDLLKSEDFRKVDCDKTPAPTKVKIKYHTGVHEVSVDSPLFEMPW